MVHEDWKGVILGLRDKDCKFPLQVDVQNDVVKLYSDEVFMGYAPPDTRAGDWVIWFTTDSHRAMDLAITARWLRSGDYALKGYVHISQNWAREIDSTSMEFHHPHVQRSSIAWDAQDLLLFEWHISHRPPADEAARCDVKRWEKFKICFEEGTLIATGQRDIDKP